MKRYKRKKKFKEGMFLVRNKKYPDSTFAKAGAWCILKNIKSSTELNVAWQRNCPEWNHQQNGIYPSKLFKRAPILSKKTKLRYKRSDFKHRDWVIGAECIIVNLPTIVFGTIFIEVNWVKWDQPGPKPINGWYRPWNFEVIK